MSETNQDGSALDVYSDPSAPRRMVVEMDYRTPIFTFDGPWTGKDIKVVQANLQRAFHRRQAGLRKEALATEGATSVNTNDKESE